MADESDALRFLADEVRHVALPAYLTELPAVRTASGRALPHLALRGLLRHLALTAFHAHPMDGRLRGSLDAGSVGALVLAVFERWQGARSPWPERWCLAVLGGWGLPAHVAVLAAQIPRWRRERREDVAALALAVLARMSTTRSLVALRSFALGTRWRGLTLQARATWADLARSRGLSPGDLDDLVLYAPDDDAPEGLARVRASALEEAMVSGRRWSAAAWSRWLDLSAEARSVASRCVWIIHGRERPIATARLTSDGLLVGVSGAPRRVPASAGIALLHPATVPPALRTRWRRTLAAAGVEPPFEQMAREVHAPSPDESVLVEASPGAASLSPGWLYGHLRCRGWDRTEPQDNGMVWGCFRADEASEVTALASAGQFWVSGDFEHERPVRVSFRRGVQTRGSIGWWSGIAAPVASGGLRLGDVPPVVYPEALRAVALLLARRRAGGEPRGLEPTAVSP